MGIGMAVPHRFYAHYNDYHALAERSWKIILWRAVTGRAFFSFTIIQSMMDSLNR
jgi:hypothetical protein